MKKILLFIALASVAFAAWTKQNARVERMTIRCTFDAAGAVTQVNVSADLVALVTNDADSTQSKGRNDSVAVNFDLLAAPVSTTNYTAATKTVNGVQLAALIRQAILDEANRQGVSP